MPRPPILPTVEWSHVFESGLDYQEWIAQGENPEHRERMETDRQSLGLDPQWVAFLGALARPVHVVAIAEDWCGDVVRHVPALQHLADAAPNLFVRYISREQFPDVFARFLTNGGEAIPKFVFLSDQFIECGNWGPMPRACRELIARGKACGDGKTARERVAQLYQADPGRREVMRELLEFIEIAAACTP